MTKEGPDSSLGDVRILRSTEVFGLMWAEVECTPRVVCSLSLVDAYSVFIIYTIDVSQNTKLLNCIDSRHHTETFKTKRNIRRSDRE